LILTIVHSSAIRVRMRGERVGAEKLEELARDSAFAATLLPLKPKRICEQA
jgi:hypothetical protein